MSKKYLYGSLNQYTVRPNYGGAETDSLIINVDNENMIISGEVNWDAALGELAHRAYPGDKGARNYAKILELTAQLEDEVSKASKSRSTVESTVAKLEKSFNTLDITVTDAIKTESKRASEAESLIFEKCREETSRALQAESKLLSELKEEVLARESVDTELLKRLDTLSGLSLDSLNEVRSLTIDEQTRAISAENELKSKIDKEITRAVESEQHIYSTIEELSSHLNSNISTINTSVGKEREERTHADNLVTSLISEESERAKQAESNISFKLESLQALTNELNRRIETLAEEITNSTATEVFSEIEDIKLNLHNTDDKITDLTSSLRVIEEELSLISSSIEELYAVNVVTREEFIQLSKQVDAVYNNVIKNVDSLNSLVNNLSTRIDKNDIQVALLTQEIEVVKQDISLIQNDPTISVVETTLDEHKLILDKHDANDHKHDVDIAQLQQDVNLLDSIQSELAQRIKNVDNLREEDSVLHNTHYDELVSRLEQEIKRSIAADHSLLFDTNRNSSRITSLQLDLTNVISNYVEKLMQADALLDDKINDEHRIIEDYKEKILTEVEKVSSNSQERDNILQEQIELVKNRKDLVPLIKNDGEVSQVYAQQGDKTFTIPAETAVVPESVVRRNASGNILLNTNFDVFTPHSAVSRLFVDTIISELRDEISSISFDFIDGGNAPIN